MNSVAEKKRTPRRALLSECRKRGNRFQAIKNTRRPNDGGYFSASMQCGGTTRAASGPRHAIFVNALHQPFAATCLPGNAPHGPDAEPFLP
ncbi:hypothetical protein DM47_3655 [Burkholderia mallei]|nr:hypothetical protein DM47_3655 [Burkholderia mallei]